MAKSTKASNSMDNVNELAGDILSILTKFTRKVNINSPRLYEHSSEIIDFMNEYQKTIEDWKTELEIECLAVAELRKQLSKKIVAYKNSCKKKPTYKD